MRIILAVMALAMLLAACSEPKKDIKDTIFAPQVKALEKARSVENTLRQGEQKNREALELSEKPAPPEQR
jgi:PBP1b-binding outer membrane lipoprotein LpoB